MKKYISVVVLLMFTFLSFGQNNNTYEYIQLQKRYSFQDNENQNRLSELLKVQFENMGYKVFYMEDGIPVDVQKDFCKVITCDVEKGSSVFLTELTIVLKDCNKKILAKGSGSSRLKLRSKSYPDAIRQIFEKTSVGNLTK